MHFEKIQTALKWHILKKNLEKKKYMEKYEYELEYVRRNSFILNSEEFFLGQFGKGWGKLLWFEDL